MNGSIYLYTRGDDCGSSHSANRAILEACETGILKNVSFMLPAPYIEEAAQMFSGRNEFCFGLHVTMNAEWDSLKWGPVSDPHKGARYHRQQDWFPLPDDKGAQGEQS